MQKAKYVAILFIMFLAIVLICGAKTLETSDVTTNISVHEVVTQSDIESIEESLEVKEEDISTESVISEPQKIPSCGGSFKSYTNYQLLSKKSKQWTKIQCNKNAYTDDNGLRKVGEYYCVAMGSYYAKNLGDLFEVKTECGSFKVIICDFKSDKHTDVNNQYTLSNGCMVEFYVDMNVLNNTAKQMGDISYIDEKFYGEIISINKLGNYFDAGGAK